MEAIYEPNDKFNFSKLQLFAPVSINGGNHFIKFKISDKPLYIQPPNCKIKSGSSSKTTKKMGCELLFSNENELFVQWMENLENVCKKQIFENKNKWFETELNETDIDNSFTQSLKIFKSGKLYSLKTTIPSILGKCNFKIYNEEEKEIDLDDITDDNDVMLILEFQGIKCSPRNFQIEIEIKQIMVLNKPKIFESCIFKTKKPVTLLSPPSSPELSPSIKKNLEKPFSQINNEDDVREVDINLDENVETMNIKKRNDLYSNLYRDAKKKAKIARDLAVYSYLEAKNIKNTFLLDDFEDSDSDLDESYIQSLIPQNK